MSKARNVPSLLDYDFPSVDDCEVKTTKTDYTMALAPMILEAMRQFPETMLVQQQGILTLSHQIKTVEDCTGLDKFYALELTLGAMQVSRAKRAGRRREDAKTGGLT